MEELVRKRNYRKLVENLSTIVPNLCKFCESWYREYPPRALIGEVREKEEIMKIRRELRSLKRILLYVHFPFCRSRCDYCSFFTANDISKIDVRKFLVCLKREIEFQVGSGGSPKKLAAVYLGGGTPTLIGAKNLGFFMDYAMSGFVVEPGAEITIEATPESIDKEMAEAIVKAGINRVCVGVQTFNEKILARVNRHQRTSDVYRAVEQLRAAGCKNINFDLIYGLENQRVEGFIKDNVKHLDVLRPESVYIFNIQNYIKQARTLQKFKNEIPLIRQAIRANNNYSGIVDAAIKFDFQPPESQTFAYGRSRYSVLWHNNLVPNIGVGPGGATSAVLRGRQCIITKRMAANQYVRSIEEGEFAPKISLLTEDETLRRQMINNLFGGMDLSHWKKLLPRQAKVLENIIGKLTGVAVIHKNRVFLKNGFEHALPISVKNELVNYFLMSFYFIYPTEMQERLLEFHLSAIRSGTLKKKSHAKSTATIVA